MQAPIITLDVIQSLVPIAKELTEHSYGRGDYAEAPAVDSDFFYIERGDYHFVYWLDADNDAHRISRAKNERIARFLIEHMTSLVKAHIYNTTVEQAELADDELETPAPPSITPLKKRIAYDRKTGDFALYFNDESVGYAPTYLEGEARLNQLAYEALRRAA